MRFLTLFVICSLAGSARAQGGYYILQDSFQGGPTFLDNFDFWTSWDPTFGFVHYVDQDVATQFSMINVTNSTVSWGVDTTQTLDPDANLGRLSIRLTSVQTYTHGEIDIIEVVNKDANNLMSLHTMPGCSVAGADESGTLLSSDCGLGGGFAGCTVEATTPSNFGASFNAIGGGVYAMEWTSLAIRIWFFPRNIIPPTLGTPFPDVSTFGTPVANFEGSCDIDSYFYNHSLIFDVDFCGSWAGPTFQTDGCPALDSGNSWSSCNEFVALNPGAFTETYWEVNYLNVYQLVPGTAPMTSKPLSSVTPAIFTSSAVSTALSGAQGRSSTPTVPIAGTTPKVTTGTFTATSSVLSVLSSLSVSSVSASLAGTSATSSASASSSGLVSASTSLVAPSSPSLGPTSSIALSTTPVPLSPAVSSPTSSETPLQASPSLAIPLSTSSAQASVICTGYFCTSYTTAVVVETITVNMLAAAEDAQNALTSNSQPLEVLPIEGEDCPPTRDASAIPTHTMNATSLSHSRSSLLNVVLSACLVALISLLFR